ncbi:MAG: hypothetical protein NTX76_04910 [Alphaproteobacteria bacterium]|nr:hypothetical protein [Alphaproteobacteria bacterium]
MGVKSTLIISVTVLLSISAVITYKSNNQDRYALFSQDKALFVFDQKNASLNYCTADNCQFIPTRPGTIDSASMLAGLPSQMGIINGQPVMQYGQQSTAATTPQYVMMPQPAGTQQQMVMMPQAQFQNFAQAPIQASLPMSTAPSLMMNSQPLYMVAATSVNAGKSGDTPKAIAAKGKKTDTKPPVAAAAEEEATSDDTNTPADSGDASSDDKGGDTAEES